MMANEPPLADLIPADGFLTDHLEENLRQAVIYYHSLPADLLLYRYAPDKWTVKEIMVHIMDMERIYAYRAFCIARADQSELPGFDAEAYIRESGANKRSLEDLLTEYTALRSATIAMIQGLSPLAFHQSGNVYGYSTTVAALLYHLAGHELHHLQIVKDRYQNSWFSKNLPT